MQFMPERRQELLKWKGVLAKDNGVDVEMDKDKNNLGHVLSVASLDTGLGTVFCSPLKRPCSL